MTNLTGRPIVDKSPSQQIPSERRVRYAFVVCPICDSTELGRALCRACGGTGQLKAELIRVAPGSAAKSGMSKMKRTSADIKFSNAVRQRDNWTCTVCGQDFRGKEAQLDAMHFVKRRYKALRKGFLAHTGDGCCLAHDLGNALAGCRSCHMRLEGKPENEQHFRQWFGDAQCDALQTEAQQGASKRVKRKVGA